MSSHINFRLSLKTKIHLLNRFQKIFWIVMETNVIYIKSIFFISSDFHWIDLIQIFCEIQIFLISIGLSIGPSEANVTSIKYLFMRFLIQIFEKYMKFRLSLETNVTYIKSIFLENSHQILNELIWIDLKNFLTIRNQCYFNQIFVWRFLIQNF